MPHTKLGLLPALLLWGAATALPAAAFAWLRVNPGSDPKIIAPEQHFYIVSISALVCLAVALSALRATVRTRSPRVYLVAVGFLLTAGFFAVHGLATPGYLVDRRYFVVVGFSARIALLCGALFLAASALPFTERASRRLVGFRVPLFAATGALLVGYAMLGLMFPESVPPRIMSARLFLDSTLGAVVVCCAFAAFRYGQLYRRGGEAVYGALAIGAMLMLEAQVVMHFGELWRWSWWLYHFDLLAAFSTMVAFPFAAPIAERRARRQAESIGLTRAA